MNRATQATQKPGHKRDLKRILDSRAGDYLFVVPAVVFIALLMLYPLAYNIVMSFYDVQLGNFLNGGAPFVGLEKYSQAFGDPDFQHALVVSLLYTGASIIIALVIGFALALFFKETFLGSDTMRAVLLLGWILPSVVSANVWRWMLAGDNGVVNYILNSLGILGKPVVWLTQADTALVAVIIATVWVTIPFDMILILAGLQSISESLYEAARVDGANAWRRFLYVTLPLMRPVALTTVLLSFIITFKTLDNIYIMTRGGPGNATNIVPIYAYNQAFQFFHFSDGAAATNVLLVISLLLAAIYLWLSRQEEGA